MELWRLKVHHRAKPGVRGSGQERGHGCELRICPKCGVKLTAGKHHVKCAAGKSSLTYLRPKKGEKRASSPGTTVVRTMPTMRTRKAAEVEKAEETEDAYTYNDGSELLAQKERLLSRLRQQDDAENWANKLLDAAALMNEERDEDDGDDGDDGYSSSDSEW